MPRSAAIPEGAPTMRPEAGSRRAAPDWLARTAAILSQDRAVYAVIALHALAAVTLLHVSGATAVSAFSAYIVIWPVAFFLLFPFIYAMLGVLTVVHRFDRRRRLAFRLLFSRERLAHFAAGLLLLSAVMIFQGSFTSLKNAFPIWSGGFRHEMLFADADRLIHLGTDPWRYLYGFTASDTVRGLIEWNYDQVWFVLCYAALFWIAVAKEARALRTRYLLSYLAVWIVVGNVLAGLFPSAGPAFYGLVTGDAARFGDQLAFLAKSGASPHSARAVQDYLWGLYASGEPGFGSGISAFPSMHVSLITLNAFFLAERSRRLGLLALAYVALIAVSSVYLAWHYAIDGYAGIAVTIMLFLGIRWAMDTRHSDRKSTFPEALADPA